MNLIITIISLLVFCLIFVIAPLFRGESHASFLIDFKKAYENYEENGYANKYLETKYKKTYIKNGYLLFSDSNRYFHRWVMEKHLGRRLTKEEVVHHIDGNKLNNKIKNLKLFKNQAEHHAHHLNNLRISGDWHKREPMYFYYKKFSYTR